MKIHVLHHVHLPIKHGITQYLDASPHAVSHTYVHEKDIFPALSDVDWLIVMGGPMSINDGKACPWLADEKLFIKDVIDAGKTVFGICLGAQLIANVLGARITKMKYPEFGWHPITPLPDIKDTLLANIFSQDLTLFHSHGEMFDIPPGAKRIAYSQACPNQGFIYKDRIIGIQFHPEITVELAALFTAHCDKTWKKSPFCQHQHSTKKDNERFELSANTLAKLMKQVELSVT